MTATRRRGQGPHPAAGWGARGGTKPGQAPGQAPEGGPRRQRPGRAREGPRGGGEAAARPNPPRPPKRGGRGAGGARGRRRKQQGEGRRPRRTGGTADPRPQRGRRRRPDGRPPSARAGAGDQPTGTDPKEKNRTKYYFCSDCERTISRILFDFFPGGGERPEGPRPPDFRAAVRP